MQTPAWTEKAPGVWATVVGEPSTFTPLGIMQAQPALGALQDLGSAPLPFDLAAITTERSARRTVVCLPLEPDERLYGLGLQFMRVNHRGRTRYLRVNSDPKEDTGESHAPVPFYVSSRGYGVLVNTARIVSVYCGSCTRLAARRGPALHDRNTDPQWQATPEADRVEIVLPPEGAELCVFAGPTALDVVRRYVLYQGGGALPPRWGLGFWHRVPLSSTAEQALAEARAFREHDVPCDVIGLEPGWHSTSYPSSFEWSPERFPHPQQFLHDMAAEGFHINLWEHPYVSPRARLYPQLLPYAGSHTVWGGLAPDYTLPEAQTLLKAQHAAEHIGIGVSGYKLDECDGSELTGAAWMFPAHATFPSGRDGEELRQVYGLILQKMICDMFRERDQRTYGLVRASAAGASALPFVLYSDLYDHRQFVRALCNAGFSGLLWTPEIRSARSAEDWVRRMQVVCFSPLAMLNAWSDGTKPWSYPEVEPIIRHYIQLRMRLLPYFYAAFARYHYDGTPPFRAMALEIGNSTARRGDTDVLALDDQYMAGDSLLVAPLFAGQSQRDVYLPEGVWYDFETGERYAGGRTHHVSPGLGKLPLFVRDGGIIPLMPALPHAPRPGEAVPLEVRHYGTAPGRFALFDDDGESLAYERGQYRWRVLEVQLSPDGSYYGTISPAEADDKSSYGEVTWRFIH